MAIGFVDSDSLALFTAQMQHVNCQIGPCLQLIKLIETVAPSVLEKSHYYSQSSVSTKAPTKKDYLKIDRSLKFHLLVIRENRKVVACRVGSQECAVEVAGGEWRRKQSVRDGASLHDRKREVEKRHE